MVSEDYLLLCNYLLSQRTFFFPLIVKTSVERSSRSLLSLQPNLIYLGNLQLTQLDTARTLTAISTAYTTEADAFNSAVKPRQSTPLWQPASISTAFSKAFDSSRGLAPFNSTKREERGRLLWWPRPGSWCVPARLVP